MKVDLNTFTIEQNNKLACVLGEIQRHLSEDTELLNQLGDLGINLSSEIDGYNCAIAALYELQNHANKNI